MGHLWKRREASEFAFENLLINLAGLLLLAWLIYRAA